MAKAHGKKSMTVDQLAAWVARLNGSIEELRRAIEEPSRRTWRQWLRGARR